MTQRGGGRNALATGRRFFHTRIRMFGFSVFGHPASDAIREHTLVATGLGGMLGWSPLAEEAWLVPARVAGSQRRSDSGISGVHRIRADAAAVGEQRAPHRGESPIACWLGLQRHDVPHAARPDKLRISATYMVGATGIEPVTPAV